jgi:hypothetical protein
VSIVAVVRGKWIWMLLVDKTSIIRENAQKDEAIKDLREDNTLMRETIANMRLSIDGFRDEIVDLNSTIKEMKRSTAESIERVERKLGAATGFIVDLIEYIDEHPTDRRRPEPPFEIRADVENARLTRK